MIPHFALPFRIVAGAVAVNEQDTVQDIAACAEAVLRYPVGFCVELPAFGTPDQTFQQGGADPAVITAALNTWEPRATAELQPSAIDDLVQTVRIEIGGQSGS